jgi:putative ABC transport system ATP-binding protein
VSPPVVRLEGVRKRYRDGTRTVDAVAALDLVLPPGVLWALAGPSGSGKTTLLGLMGGMVAPTEGRVALCGEDITHLRDHHRTARRRERVGFVFQELALIEGMTLLENVLLPLAPSGGADAAATRRAIGLLERFGIAPLAQAVPERVSGGQRQRAALCRALMLDPPLLLLDEPTAHLDAEATGEVLRLLAELRDEGRSLVVATHDPRLYEDPRVDRVLRLVDGRLEDGTGQQKGGEDE